MNKIIVDYLKQLNYCDNCKSEFSEFKKTYYWTLKKCNDNCIIYDNNYSNFILKVYYTPTGKYYNNLPIHYQPGFSAAGFYTNFAKGDEFVSMVYNKGYDISVGLALSFLKDPKIFKKYMLLL